MTTTPADPPTLETTPAPKQALLPYTIEGSACEHCGGELAWRSGVSRPVVLTHAKTGNDKCPAPLATLREADIPLAQTAINNVAFLMELGRNAPNA